MSHTLFVSTYYNTPHFVRWQKAALQLYLKGGFTLLCADDAPPGADAMLTPTRRSSELMREQCDEYWANYVRVPQSVHASVSAGGLVPDGLPIGHPTERHRATLHWLLRSRIPETRGYDYYVLFDSDMFLRRQIDMDRYMDGLDVLGTGHYRHELRNTGHPDQFWPASEAHRQSVVADHLTMCLTIFRASVIPHLADIDIGGFAGTDTGGRTHFWFERHPELRKQFLNTISNRESQVQLITADGSGERAAEWLHLRAGSNWDAQSMAYYREKLRRAIKDYLPLLGYSDEAAKERLVSRDGEHAFEVTE